MFHKRHLIIESIPQRATALFTELVSREINSFEPIGHNLLDNRINVGISEAFSRQRHCRREVQAQRDVVTPILNVSFSSDHGIIAFHVSFLFHLTYLHIVLASALQRPPP